MASTNVANPTQTPLNYKDQSDKLLLPQENFSEHFLIQFHPPKNPKTQKQKPNKQNQKNKQNKQKPLIIFSNISSTFFHFLKTLSSTACDSKQGIINNCRGLYIFISLTTTSYICALSFPSCFTF